MIIIISLSIYSFLICCSLGSHFLNPGILNWILFRNCWFSNACELTKSLMPCRSVPLTFLFTDPGLHFTDGFKCRVTFTVYKLFIHGFDTNYLTHFKVFTPKKLVCLFVCFCFLRGGEITMPLT